MDWILPAFLAAFWLMVVAHNGRNSWRIWVRKETPKGAPYAGGPVPVLGALLGTGAVYAMPLAATTPRWPFLLTALALDTWTFFMLATIPVVIPMAILQSWRQSKVNLAHRLIHESQERWMEVRLYKAGTFVMSQKLARLPASGGYVSSFQGTWREEGGSFALARIGAPIARLSWRDGRYRAEVIPGSADGQIFDGLEFKAIA